MYQCRKTFIATKVKPQSPDHTEYEAILNLNMRQGGSEGTESRNSVEKKLKSELK